VRENVPSTTLKPRVPLLINRKNNDHAQFNERGAVYDFGISRLR
jgi:hypothetical protein